MENKATGSSEFLTAIYEVDGPESRARATAERIALTRRLRPRKTSYHPRSNPRFWVTSKSCGRLAMDGTK